MEAHTMVAEDESKLRTLWLCTRCMYRFTRLTTNYHQLIMVCYSASKIMNKWRLE